MSDDAKVSGMAQLGAQVLRGEVAGQSCRLAPLRFEHTNHVVRWRNDPDIAKWFMTKHQFERSEHEAWLTRTLASNTDFNWVIEDRASTPVGAVSIYNVDWREGRAEFGRFLIGERHARGKGLGRQAVHLALRAAREAGLLEIYLEVKPSNIAAYSLYRTIGFKEVGAAENNVRMTLTFDTSCSTDRLGDLDVR
jgi:diamine N-acetyltransferase